MNKFTLKIKKNKENNIKMLIYFSTRQVLPEFWQDWTLRVLTQDSSLTLWQPKKNLTNYCELTLHAIFTKFIGLLHNIQKKTCCQPTNFYSVFGGKIVPSVHNIGVKIVQFKKKLFLGYYAMNLLILWEIVLALWVNASYKSICLCVCVCLSLCVSVCPCVHF